MPNSTDRANSTETPNEHKQRPAVARALAAFELFQQRLMAVHATEFTAVEITMSQAKLLYVVVTGGESSMSAIAERLGVSMSTVSGAVDRLVDLGFLARSEDPRDRRQVRVSVTPLGTQTLEQLRELSTRQLRMLFELVSDEDLEVIERSIRILADAVSGTAPGTASAAAPCSSGSPGRTR